MRRSVRRDGSQAGDRGSQDTGPSGDATSVHARQSALALPELPQAQDTAGPAARQVPVGVFAGLVRRTTVAQSEPQVGDVVSAAMQPGVFSAADKRNLMAACKHEAPRQLQTPLRSMQENTLFPCMDFLCGGTACGLMSEQCYHVFLHSAQGLKFNTDTYWDTTVDTVSDTSTVLKERTRYSHWWLRKQPLSAPARSTFQPYSVGPTAISSAKRIPAVREKWMTVMWWLAMRGMGGSLASGFGRLSGCRGHRFGLVGFHLAAFVVEFGPVFNRLVS